jgi:hypothetical protein
VPKITLIGAGEPRLEEPPCSTPLGAAVCTLPQICSMVDEMLGGQAQWLSQFQETMVWFRMDRTIETASGTHFSLEERIQS